MDDGQQPDLSRELHSDNFLDIPPDRASCRILLELASDEAQRGNGSRIYSWNRLMDRFNKHVWVPDLSDFDDPWRITDLVLSIQSESGQRVVVNLDGAQLTGSRLHNANLAYTDLNGANFEGARMLHANFKGAGLNRSNLDRAGLHHVNFERALLQGASLKSSELLSANLKEAKLQRAKLDHTVLHFADLMNASLDSAHLKETELISANLEGASLNGARIDGAMMYSARLDGAELKYTQIEKTGLHGASLAGVTLNHADLEGSNLDDAKLTGADLRDASFGAIPPGIISRFFLSIAVHLMMAIRFLIDPLWTRFRSVQTVKWFWDRFINGEYAIRTLKNSSPSTVLDNADLRGISGFVPHGQSVQMTRFDAMANDPYSTVRRKYTGPMMLFHLVFLLLFFTPYILRAGAWSAVDSAQDSGTMLQYDEPSMKGEKFFPNPKVDTTRRFSKAIEEMPKALQDVTPEPVLKYFAAYEIQRALDEINTESGTAPVDVLDDTEIYADTHWVPRNLIWVVLGFRSGSMGILAGLLSIVFVMYNIIRGAMTWWMSQVRDAEERSGHLPEIGQYWWCYSLHTYFMRWVYWVAVVSFVFHAVGWATSSVMVPPEFG